MSAAAATAKLKAKQERYFKYNSARGQAAGCDRRGEYGKAVDYCNMAMDVAEEGCEFPLLLSRSRAHCKLGNYEAALQDTEQVLRHLPHNIKAIGQDAHTLYDQNDFENAMVLNVIGHRRRIKPDNFEVGTAVCRATIEKCIGKSAGPIMDQNHLGSTIVSMVTKEERDCTLNEEQKEALHKRNRAQKDKVLAEKYFGKTAKDKAFIASCKVLSNMHGANKETTQKLFEIVDKALVSLNSAQERLIAEYPVYVWKYRQPTLSTDRLKQIEEEKLRFKAGAMSVIMKLNKKLYEAYNVHQDLKRSFSLAFRLKRYILSHCKHFFSQPEMKNFLHAIYNIVGEFYLSNKCLIDDLDKDKQEQRIYCMLGSETPDTEFIRDVKESLMPHVLDKRAYCRELEGSLEVAVDVLERTFLNHELAVCWSTTKEIELSLKASQKGHQYAKSIRNNTWCINNGFVMASAHFLQGDVEDAQEVLMDSVARAVKLGRNSCVIFLEKVLEIIKKEETRPFVTESPVKKRQQQIIDLMPNLDMKRQIEALFRKNDSLPPEKQFNILPKIDDSQSDIGRKRAIRLTAQVKRRTVITMKIDNPCLKEPYSDAPATFTV